MSVDDVERPHYRESGFLGVSGMSHDVRALLASDAPRAAEAIEPDDDSYDRFQSSD